MSPTDPMSRPAKDAASPFDLEGLVRQLTWQGLVTAAQLRECPTAEPQALLAALERKGYLTPFQLAKLRRGDRDGYTLGGYRLLYRISAGSFGRVFRADDPRTGRVVALKVLRRHVAEDPAEVEAFRREARLGMSLQHPNVVEVLEVGRDAGTGQHFLVMEFVEGGSLRDFLAVRGKLEPAEALRLLEDMAAGLTYAFGRGLTHRDLKPTNVLICSRGTAKLADFGLGRLRASPGTAEPDSQPRRTVGYAALERATDVKPGDTRSDIYFLGCIFYEMLTGRPPAPTAGDSYAGVRGQRGQDLPIVRVEDVEGPPAVRSLLEGMTTLDPQYRYQTPAQLLEAVRAARAAVIGAGWAEALTVYVVEQDGRLLGVIRDRLKREGYRVLASVDPQRAVERFAQTPYDVLVVDIGSTREDGLAALRRVLTEARRRGTACKAVVLCSRKQREAAAALLASPGIGGSVAVLTRPVSLGELTAKVRELLSAPEAAPVIAWKPS